MRPESSLGCLVVIGSGGVLQTGLIPCYWLARSNIWHGFLNVAECPVHCLPKPKNLKPVNYIKEFLGMLFGQKFSVHVQISVRRS